VVSQLKSFYVVWTATVQLYELIHDKINLYRFVLTDAYCNAVF